MYIIGDQKMNRLMRSYASYPPELLVCVGVISTVEMLIIVSLVLSQTSSSWGSVVVSPVCAVILFLRCLPWRRPPRRVGLLLPLSPGVVILKKADWEDWHCTLYFSWGNSVCHLWS